MRYFIFHLELGKSSNFVSLGKNVEIVQIYAWMWRICVNIQMTAISSPNHAMFYILSASQLLCKFHGNKSEIVAKLARTVQIMPAPLATIKDNLCVQNSYFLRILYSPNVPGDRDGVERSSLDPAATLAKLVRASSC